MEGYRDKRPPREDVPVPPPGQPECPEHLDEIARKHWTKLTKLLGGMGLLTSADEDAIAAYCQSYSRWVQAEASIKKYGLMIASKDKKSLIKSPYLKISDDAKDRMLRIGLEFGLTPSSRSRVSVTKAKPAGSGIAKFLKLHG